MTTSSNPRYQQLQAWLQSLTKTHALQLDTLATASSDASFRRYYRLNSSSASTKTTGQATSYIVMDAPPPYENCQPFIEVGNLLQTAGLTVPEVIAQNLEHGFLLLSDLGPTTYLDAIRQGLLQPKSTGTQVGSETTHNTQAAQPADYAALGESTLNNSTLQALYRDAIQALVKMQQINGSGLPIYTQQWLVDELNLFIEWYVKHHCQTSLSDADQAMLAHTFKLLAADNMRQPFVLVHRDFHSPNLMLMGQGQNGRNPGIIDYQDALLGPISYDIASLVMDARTTWEEDQQLDWAIRYWEQARDAKLPVPDSFADFHRNYEWMSLQRNLRILGVFARLAYRDNKKAYLPHIPRVNTYIRQVASRYKQFGPLLKLLNRIHNVEEKVGLSFY